MDYTDLEREVLTNPDTAPLIGEDDPNLRPLIRQLANTAADGKNHLALCTYGARLEEMPRIYLMKCVTRVNFNICLPDNNGTEKGSFKSFIQNDEELIEEIGHLGTKKQTSDINLLRKIIYTWPGSLHRNQVRITALPEELRLYAEETRKIEEALDQQYPIPPVVHELRLCGMCNRPLPQKTGYCMCE